MTFRVTYKQDLTEAAGSPAARRLTVDVSTDPDEFTATLNRLMNDAHIRGHQIIRVVIDRPALQAA